MLLNGTLTAKDILDYQCHKRPSIWAQRYTRLKGMPYRFEVKNPDGTIDFKRPQLQRRFLVEPLDDQHPHKATQKARQLGLSENGVRESLWFADQHDFTKQVYTFPTDGQVKDFSRTRIAEVIADSPYLQRRMGFDPNTRKRIDNTIEAVDNVKLKKISKSYIFFRSGATPKAGEGIDCDIVYFDEIDRMHPNVTIAFNETLSASPFGWRRDISTPTLPGVGVNASFAKSDQRHWFMKCPHCNNWFTLILEYPRCIVDLPEKWKTTYPHLFKDTDTHAYICVKCGKPVENETRVRGLWYPLYANNKNVRGYQLTQLVAPWITATSVMKKREDYKIEQLFANYVIGITYLGDNILITEKDVDRCINLDYKNPGELKLKNVVVGGDWGNESWQVAAMPHPEDKNIWILLDILKISDKDTANPANTAGTKVNPHIKFSVDFFRKWRGALGVYDAGYGKDRNFELLNNFPAKIFSCYYPNNENSYTKDFEDRWEDASQKVSVDRTASLKVMIKKFIDQEIIIPEWIYRNPLYPTFKKHITNLVSIKEISENKDGVEKVTERIGALPGGDHFGHAMNYLAIGLRKVRNRPKSAFFM